MDLVNSDQMANIEEIVFMNGSESTVSTESMIKGLVDNMREVNGGIHNDKIKRMIFPASGHLATVNARVHAANIRLILEGSSLPGHFSSEMPDAV